MRRSSGTKPMPRRQMVSDALPPMSAPSKAICPADGASQPAMVFITVVLPTPLRPNSPITSPALTLSEIPCSTWLKP